MSIDVGPTARAGQKSEPETVWVRTASGLLETTVPRPAATFLAGYGSPTADIGTDGAVYLDVVAARFYGPKAGSSWPPIGWLASKPKE